MRIRATLLISLLVACAHTDPTALPSDRAALRDRLELNDGACRFWADYGGLASGPTFVELVPITRLAGNEKVLVDVDEIVGTLDRTPVRLRFEDEHVVGSYGPHLVSFNVESTDEETLVRAAPARWLSVRADRIALVSPEISFEATRNAPRSLSGIVRAYGRSSEMTVLHDACGLDVLRRHPHLMAALFGALARTPTRALLLGLRDDESAGAPGTCVRVDAAGWAHATGEACLWAGGGPCWRRDARGELKESSCRGAPVPARVREERLARLQSGRRAKPAAFSAAESKRSTAHSTRRGHHERPPVNEGPSRGDGKPGRRPK
jgi:hypothetical protein